MTNLLPYECKCFVISYKPENRSTVTLRAYRNNDSLQCLDINFFTTHYLCLPVAFEETLLEIASEEETLHILPFLVGLPEGLRQTATVFRFGPKNSGKYIVSSAYSIQQQVLNEGKITLEPKEKQLKLKKNTEIPMELSKISGFMLNTMFFMEGRSYLSITATTDIYNEVYHMECQGIQYLQAPVASWLGCEPFSIADMDEAIRFAQKNGCEKQSDIILLKTSAKNAPVNILCTNLLISREKT
jgi:hypothetical protein